MRIGGNNRADRSRSLLRKHRREQELARFAAEVEATEEHSEQSEAFWRTMAGFVLIKQFPSSGYEAWEDPREVGRNIWRLVKFSCGHKKKSMFARIH